MSRGWDSWVSDRPLHGASRVEALRQGLRDLGYIEGKNIVIEFRWADGVDQLPEFAAEFVRMNVDIIFAASSTMVEPARQATKTIPIVFAVHADPVSLGHVASLARPGGNITGLSMLSHRPRRQGLRNIDASCTTGDADRSSLESHNALASARLEGSRDRR